MNENSKSPKSDKDNNNPLTHFNQAGEAHMVNITDKNDSHRKAIAQGRIYVSPTVAELIQAHGHKKGDVLGIARIAGIMAAKKTAELIPLCHPIPITAIEIDFTFSKDPTKAEKECIDCQVHCETTGKTGIEMEALTACSTALLTIYDMCKAVDKGMIISEIKLLKKTGGKSGDFEAPSSPIT